MRLLYVAGATAIAGTFIYDIWFNINYEFDANISLTYLAILVTAFTVLYAARSNWKTNTVGKVVMVKSVFLAAVLWQIVVSVWFGSEYPFRQEIRFALYTAGAWAYGAMVLTLWKQQQFDRKVRKQIEQENSEQ